MARILGIDYGTARIGLAISDPLGVLARGLKTLPVAKMDLEDIVQWIAAVIEVEQVETVVMGLPKRTDGKPSESEAGARALAAALEAKTGMSPVWWDERYTTVIAHRQLSEAGFKTDRKRRRTEVIDQVAATVLLQEYLDANR